MSLRIDLVAQVADALADAHAIGVLHKDIKPSNVLMRTDPLGRPGIVLSDFGSGRAMDQSRLDAFGITRMETGSSTESGGAGTRIYQAPEIASGGLPTVQADIYALGVMLYQLAAGDLRRALAPGWEEHVADPLLRQDIALAAAGDPARRLATAAALATRLRSLPERRLAASRASDAADEAAHLRRALEAASARRGPMRALAGVLLLGCAASTYLYVRAENAGRRARQEAARAQAVTSFLTDDLFSAANPVLGANPNVPVKAVLSAASADLDHKFAPGTLDRATVEAAIGGAYAGLADPDHALPLLRTALATFRHQLGDAAPQAQAVRLVMADLAERTADLPGVRAAGAEVLAAHPTDADTELRGRFAVLYADCLDDDTDSACVAKLRPFLAEVQQRTGSNSLLALRVDDLLAYQLAEGQHFAEAIPLARRTVALSQSLFGPDSLHAQERRFHLALVLNEAKQHDEATAILVDVRRRLLALSGTETELSNRVATQLGRAYAEAGRYGEAVPLLRASLAFTEHAHGENFEFTRHGINLLAKTLSDAGDSREALLLGERALRLQRAAQGPDNEDTLWIEGNLAEEYRKSGDLARAEATYDDVVARARRVFTHGEWDRGHFEMLLGQVQAAAGKIDPARANLADSVHVLSAALGPDDERTKAAAATLAGLHPPP
jgi:non-specific serine/threonine protein kinase